MKLDLPPHQPDFQYLIKTLKREKTDRPVLFEFIIDPGVCALAAPLFAPAERNSLEYYRMIIQGFMNLGYDYAPVYAWKGRTFSFEKGDHDVLDSRSMNQGALISDRTSFESYRWPQVRDSHFEIYDQLRDHVPDGMKLLACSDGGILENAIDLVGFENLCLMYLTDPDLTGAIFDHIGSRLLEFYARVSSIESIGVCMVNDDWGFKTQTMFPAEMMEEYVFPYVRKIVDSIHRNGKMAILHSCGNLKNVMDVIIDDLHLDGKHSFEDNICPVEDAYDWWHDRIAIMGGVDVDFLARRSPDEIYRRSVRLLEKTFDRGGFALGSGNSIPSFIPLENYLAMLRAAREFL